VARDKHPTHGPAVHPSARSTDARVYNKSAKSAVEGRKTQNKRSATRLSAAELESLHKRRESWVSERCRPLVASDQVKHVGPPEPPHLVERKPVDSRLFAELADIARIPSSNFDRFRECISYELTVAWRLFRIKLDSIDPVEGRIALKQLQKLNAASKAFSAALRSLNGVALIPVRMAAYEFLNDLPTKDQMETYLSVLSRGIEKYVDRVLYFATDDEKPVRRVGHPPGGLLTQWWDPFVILVLNVLWDVDATGGQLTIDKNNHEGSLLKVLNSMEPYLPPGFLPKPLPVSTLVRMKAAARKFAGKYPMLQHPTFQDEDKARKNLETVLWPYGPVCGYCGNADSAKITKVQGKKHSLDHYNCNECKRQFTVATRTILERSKIRVTKWLIAAYVFDLAEDAAAANEIRREVGVTYETACLTTHHLTEWRNRIQDAFPRRKGSARSVLGFSSFVWEYGFGGMRSRAPRVAPDRRPGFWQVYE
jgi:transposase-like protein